MGTFVDALDVDMSLDITELLPSQLAEVTVDRVDIGSVVDRMSCPPFGEVVVEIRFGSKRWGIERAIRFLGLSDELMNGKERRTLSTLQRARSREADRVCIYIASDASSKSCPDRCEISASAFGWYLVNGACYRFGYVSGRHGSAYRGRTFVVIC